MNTHLMSTSELFAEAENLRRRINGKHLGEQEGNNRLEGRLKAIEAELNSRDHTQNTIV